MLAPSFRIAFSGVFAGETGRGNCLSFARRYLTYYIRNGGSIQSFFLCFTKILRGYLWAVLEYRGNIGNPPEPQWFRGVA